MNISFGAKFINNVSVLRMTNNKPIEVKTAVVELQSDNLDDWFAIEDFAQECSKNNNKSNYAIQIKDSFNSITDNNKVDNNLHHYMLTVQQSDFEHLDSKQVLGAFMITDKLDLSDKRKQSIGAKSDYVTKIRFLQGLPQNYYENPNREYSKTGKAMIDFTKDKYCENDIVVHVDKSEIPFYISQGFILSSNPSAPDMMIYHHRTL